MEARMKKRQREIPEVGIPLSVHRRIRGVDAFHWFWPSPILHGNETRAGRSGWAPADLWMCYKLRFLALWRTGGCLCSCIVRPGDRMVGGKCEIERGKLDIVHRSNQPQGLARFGKGRSYLWLTSDTRSSRRTFHCHDISDPHSTTARTGCGIE